MSDVVVVTGGGHGLGRTTVEHLLSRGTAVVALERDAAAVDWLANWLADHPTAARATAVLGDAGDHDVAQQAVDAAEALGGLTGWVNNAAVFRDADLAEDPLTVAALVETNLRPALVGSAVAVRRFLAAGRPGSVVNVSSHQAQRPVRGALAYATAKAAVEGLTRALAVDYGPRGVRANAVALGSVETERYTSQLAALSPTAAAELQAEMARLHPLGRVARAQEVATVIAFLLSADAGFVSGTVLAVDGGRAALGLDPEAT